MKHFQIQQKFEDDFISCVKQNNWVKKNWQVFLTNGINVHIWYHITINWLSGLHYNRYWHGNLRAAQVISAQITT